MLTISAAGIPITTRTTVQRANFREMPLIVDVAKAAGAGRISFLAVDVSNQEAFGPRFQADSSLPIHAPPSPALLPDDMPEFYAVVDRLERTYQNDFAAHRIAESLAKLRLMGRYFEAVNGQVPFVPPACNAPHLSAVVEVDGTLRPCFFLPTSGKLTNDASLSAFNSDAMLALRRAYRNGDRPECERCVCPLYRSARALVSGV
jgi:MoaA/NifB/PqqE/SkfB family radical SAM enzyme